MTNTGSTGSNAMAEGEAIPEEDLSTFNASFSGGPKETGTPAALAPPVQTPDEKKRGEIATWLVLTLVAVVGVAALGGLWAVFLSGCNDDVSCKAVTTRVENLKIIVEIVLTPLIGIVGAVVGFYFGGKAAENKLG